MKPLLKNTKESCNKEEKQEEDKLLEHIKFLYIFNLNKFDRSIKKLTI